MRIFALLSLLLLAACATPTGAQTPAFCGLVGRTELPSTRLGLFAAVESTVDGAKALLVVDTGAARTVLSAETARRAGAVLDLQRVVRSTGIGGTAVYPTARINRLLLGRVPVLPAMVTIMPEVPVADGNIGMDILGEVELDLDMWAGRITLYQGRLCPGAGPPWPRGATELQTAVPMSPLLPPAARPRLLLVAITLDGVPALAQLDSGAGRSFVARSFAARLGVTDAALAASPPLRLTGLSPQDGLGRLWRFREAKVGAERLRAPEMVVTDLHDQGFDVLLGMDYLGSHRVWMSYATRRVFVSPP